MKRYELTATTAKSDIIAGLMFPVIIMTPILAIQLISFYLKLVLSYLIIRLKEQAKCI